MMEVESYPHHLLGATVSGRSSLTMADVARLAGVSTATVSHVVNKSRRHTPATERRVHEAIEQLGYVRDPFARSLRTRTSGIIGIAMSAISNPYFATIVQEIERNLRGTGTSIILADTHDDPVIEDRVVEDLMSRRVDGLVLAPSRSPERALRLAARYGGPLVVVDRIDTGIDCDQVAVENVEPVREITAHLLDLGHTRLGMVTGIPGMTTSEERLRGFLLAHEEAGLDVDPALVRSGRSSSVGAREAVEEMLDLSNPPTALVAGNNAMTIGTLRALKTRGRRVPDDMALVCFDDFEWADLFEPALTAIAQPVRAMAQRAVEMLNSRRSDSSIAVRREVLRPVVAHRTSCGCGGVAPGRPARPGGLHWENTGASGHAPHDAGEPGSATSSRSPSTTRSA